MMEGSKKFLVAGTFKDRHDFHKFSKEIAAWNEKLAKDKVYSLLGSNHKIKRQHINIEEVKEI